MFNNCSLVELLGEEHEKEFDENPPTAYALRRRGITLQEFYEELRHHFQFNAC